MGQDGALFGAETDAVRPISFFVHHQGRGHANRTMAIVRRMRPERRVTVMTAKPSL